jgi:hypothetical protein
LRYLTPPERVKETRLRKAVDTVAQLQFDRHGNRAWKQAAQFLDAQRTRQAVGEVAVAFGRCSEPANVSAGRGQCPLRFRCLGCEHFSTDVSYLPELRSYLDDLLRTRERLQAMITADDWAKREAMPSEEEIARLRRLIRRVSEDLGSLTSEPGPLGNCGQAPLQVTAGLFRVPGDAAHRDGRGDDHVGEFGQQVITGTADSLPPVQPVHPDERIGHLADLFRQLQQPHLGRDIFVIGIQLADLIPHGFLRC